MRLLPALLRSSGSPTQGELSREEPRAQFVSHYTPHEPAKSPWSDFIRSSIQAEEEIRKERRLNNLGRFAFGAMSDLSTHSPRANYSANACRRCARGTRATKR
jgi:hypothetical protein